MRKPRLLTAIALVLCLAAAAAAAPVPEGGIGITSAPDSVTAIGVIDTLCSSGWMSGTAPAGASFGVFDMSEWSDWVDLDVDFLIDENFSTHSGLLNPVSNYEATRFLRSLDLEHDNRFGWPFTDLGMTYKGFGETEYAPYDAGGEGPHFLLFPLCPDTLERQNDHVDIYLVPATNGGEGWTSNATYTSSYRVPEED